MRSGIIQLKYNRSRRFRPVFLRDLAAAQEVAWLGYTCPKLPPGADWTALVLPCPLLLNPLLTDLPSVSPSESAAPAALLTREQVLRALRLLGRAGAPPLPPATVYELVYRGRRYPPRAVAEQAYRLAQQDAAARWPLPAGRPTNAVLEKLDFTISTRRPSLSPGSAQDGEQAAEQQAQELYVGPEKALPAAHPTRPNPLLTAAAEAAAPYQASLPPYTKEQALSDLFLTESELNAALAGLRRRRNLLLQGPPGTGKTYLARRLAWLLLGRLDDSRIELVQFHPSYGYEDFVLGFRPGPDGQFGLVPGVLPLLCERAAHDPSQPYFLLIDELNRGNVARIFGELLLLLEADKRGPAHALRLPYAPPEMPRFFVPENVYVIGTLNLADRSLAPLDYALRRRFAFVSLRPQFGEGLKKLLTSQGRKSGAGPEYYSQNARPEPGYHRRSGAGAGFRSRPQLLLPAPGRRCGRVAAPDF